MKAKPVTLILGQGYVDSPIENATHIMINIPGPTGILRLPVIKGRREGTGCWTWNGSVDAPTLRPSILTIGHDFRCHSWVTDGKVQFLADCSHSLVNQVIDLCQVY